MHIIRDLTLRSAASFSDFLVMKIFIDDYLSFIVCDVNDTINENHLEKHTNGTSTQLPARPYATKNENPLIHSSNKLKFTLSTFNTNIGISNFDHKNFLKSSDADVLGNTTANVSKNQLSFLL